MAPRRLTCRGGRPNPASPARSGTGSPARFRDAPRPRSSGPPGSRRRSRPAAGCACPGAPRARASPGRTGPSATRAHASRIVGRPVRGTGAG
jgi:hypothetical protein